MIPHAVHTQPTLWDSHGARCNKEGKDKRVASPILEKLGGNGKSPDEGERKELTFTECITRVRSCAMCFKYINSFHSYNDLLMVESFPIL